jgi:hypothetical protein
MPDTARLHVAFYETDLLDAQPVDFMGMIFRPVTYPLLDTIWHQHQL